MKEKRFYGWINVGFSALMIFTVLGFNATIPQYVAPISQSLNVERSVVSLIPTIIGLALLLTSISYGLISKLAGIKKLLVMGVIMIPIGMIVMAISSNLTIYYICAVVIGIGFTLTSTIPQSAILSN